jgi:hypothetical protein
LFSASLAACASADQPSAGAETFVDRVIAYETSGSANIRSPAFAGLLAPSLRAAVKSDLTGPDVGVLDYDPLCDCQDAAGLKMRPVSIKGDSSVAIATIENAFGEERRLVRLRLENGKAGWQIADIASSQRPSLLKALRGSEGSTT